MSKAEMRAIFNKTQGANAWPNRITLQINEYGKKAAVLHERPDSDDPKRLAITEQAADFIYRRHNKGPRTEDGNPFIDLTQHQLSAIVYDDSGTFTDIERYAAMYLRDDRNQAVLEKIGALVFHPDERLLPRAQLEHFDSLSPIEQSIYPDDHREIYLGYLNQAEQEHGKLEVKSLLQILIEQDALLRRNLKTWEPTLKPWEPAR